jgi:hypothetical protein
MELTTLSEIELLTIQTEQQAIFQQAQHNLQVIGNEIAKRVEAHKTKEVKTESTE